MALAEFLHNVQTARNVVVLHLFPQYAAGEASSLARVSADWERLRAAVPLWLTPTVVRAFDAAQATFLPPERRTELAVAVGEYRQTAEIAERQPPADEELRAGLGALGRMSNLLGDALSVDSEGLALLAALLSGGEPLPQFVLGFDYSLGADSTGDPAVWVWVVLRDELDPMSDEFAHFARSFPDRVRKALRLANSSRLPYVRYRPLSEARQQLQGTAA